MLAVFSAPTNPWISNYIKIVDLRILDSKTLKCSVGLNPSWVAQCVFLLLVDIAASFSCMLPLDAMNRNSRICDHKPNVYLSYCKAHESTPVPCWNSCLISQKARTLCCHCRGLHPPPPILIETIWATRCIRPLFGSGSNKQNLFKSSTRGTLFPTKCLTFLWPENSSIEAWGSQTRSIEARRVKRNTKTIVFSVKQACTKMLNIWPGFLQ